MNKKFFFLSIVFFLLVLAGASLWFLSRQNRGAEQNMNDESRASEENKSQNTNGDQNNPNQETQNSPPLEQVQPELSELSIHSNDVISSPVVIEGKAKREWFEQGKFSVFVLDERKNTLGSGVAIMKEQLFDEDTVPFIATVDFSATVPTGLLVLRKGISPLFSENAVHQIIPVQIKQSSSQDQANGCRPSGCSGQVCSDQNVVTDCSYKEEYVCYEKAKCERQENGQCGWTQTKELVACLGQFE